MSGKAKLPIVYQDGLRVVAVEHPTLGYNSVLYAMSRKGEHKDGPELVLNQNEARERDEGEARDDGGSDDEVVSLQST